MTTPTAGEVLTVSDEEIADLLKQITDLGRLLDISQECVRDLRARLAAAESALEVQTALLADASSQLCALRNEVDSAETQMHKRVFADGKFEWSLRAASPEITDMYDGMGLVFTEQELIIRPRGGKGE